MSVSNGKIAEIRQWLISRYVVVPAEWIEACVSFLIQEYKDPHMSIQRLKNQVYEQWLAADLTEIGVATLPSDTPTSQKMSLTGVYALQVNGIRDVGRPAYAQLRQLEGRINADLEVSAAPKAALPEWESKPTRMLMLNLTDGVSCVQGMEYKPITLLSPNLPPGVKILVKGPLECRFGLLLLTASNIEVLGGEVEKFQAKFSREEMLKDALQLGGNQEDNSSRVAANEVAQDQLPRNRTNASHQRQIFHNTRIQDNIPEAFIDSERRLALTEAPENFDDDDDFMQDLDYSVIDEIERANSQQNQVNQGNSQKNVRNDNSVPNQSPTEEIKEPCTSKVFSDFESFKEKDICAAVTSIETLPRVEFIKKEFTVTIKGSVSKVLSRLECKVMGGWHLTATVNDETSHIDVDFHDEVLSKFVGCSATKMISMKTQASTDQKVREQVTWAISNFKKTLQRLNCVMDVKFKPGERPCVIKCYK